MQLPEFAQFYREICNFDRFLGLDLQVDAPGRIRYRLTVSEAHLSMPGACHGGVLAAMMDATLGLTALSKVFDAGQLCQTVEFKINYLSNPGVGERLTARGALESCGQRLIVASARIVADDGRGLASGLGTFSLYPLAKRAERLGLPTP